MGKAAEHGHMNTRMQAGIELGMGMQMAETMMQGIKQSNNSIQSLQEQEKCRKMCPQCKAVIKEGVKFCSECGAKIQTEALLAKFCIECGEKLEPGMKFCSKCGHKVKKTYLYVFFLLYLVFIKIRK